MPNMCLGIIIYVFKNLYLSVGLHTEINYIRYKLLEVYVDVIPWLYNSFPIRFDEAGARSLSS